MWGKPYLRGFIYNHCFLKVTCSPRFEAGLANEVLTGRVVLMTSFHSVTERLKKEKKLVRKVYRVEKMAWVVEQVPSK